MEIKRLVNDKVLWDSFCEVVDEYIAFTHKQLEQMPDPTDFHRLQGEVKAYRKLKQLRDKVNGETREKK